MTSGQTKTPHPHFDQGIIEWDDSYSGKYPQPPTGYSKQFDLQWKIALEGNKEYYDHSGASVDDDYIQDRIYEWTGKNPSGKGFKDRRSCQVLDYPIDVMLVKGKRCIDIGCGMGRWTKTMQALGAADVLSVDASESAVKSVSRFNRNAVLANIMTIPEEHPEWVEQFDFACFWGVAMCTHDPMKAFISAASTVKKGGSLYLMVYCPEGMHNRRATNIQRKKFHSLETVEEKLKYVDHVAARKWDWEYPLEENTRNLLIRGGSLIFKSWKAGKIGYLDLLQPYYNWVIPKKVIGGWMKKTGFSSYRYLYKKPRSAYHVLATK